MELFNTEEFIMAIQNRPVIWDSRLPEHSNKIAKRKAWEEITEEIFDSEFGEKTNKEKNAYAIELQKKWKSLKDCFNRERSKEKNCPSGSGAKHRKQYVYYKLLSFLQPLTEIRSPSRPSVTEENNSEGCLESFVTPKPKRLKTSDGVDDAENKLYEILTEKLNQFTTTIQHPDQYFLLSLFPHFNSIKEEYKLDAKAEMINLLRKYNNMAQPSTHTSHYGYQSGYQSYDTTAGTSNGSSVSQLINTSSYHSPPMPADANVNTAATHDEPFGTIHRYTEVKTPAKAEVFLNKAVLQVKTEHDYDQTIEVPLNQDAVLKLKTEPPEHDDDDQTSEEEPLNRGKEKIS